MVRFRIFRQLVIAVVLGSVGAVSADDSILFYHEDFPPYVYAVNGEVKGQIAERTDKIVRSAGYTIVWRQTSFSRLIREIEHGKEPACAAGYSGHRQNRFDVLASKPIGWYRGAGLTVRKEDLPRFASHASIQDVMKDTSLRGAFLMDVSYMGISDFIDQTPVKRHVLIGGSDRDLALMVARGRVHFAPLNADQVEHLKKYLPGAQGLTAFQPSGMREPRDVGIICSKKLSPDVWDKINAQIPPLLPFEDDWKEKAAQN